MDRRRGGTSPALRPEVAIAALDSETLVVDAGTGVLLRLTTDAATGTLDGGSAALERLGLTKGSTPLDRRALLGAAAALGIAAVVLPSASAAASPAVSFVASTGSVDLSFDANIASSVGVRVDDIAVREDGSIMIAGYFDRVGASQVWDVALLDENGAVATGFTAFDRYRHSSFTGAHAVLDTGAALVVGASYSSLEDTSTDPNTSIELGGPIFTVTTTGSISPLLSEGTSNPNDEIRALASDTEGRLIVGGVFDNIAFVETPTLARLHANGEVDLTFAPFSSSDGSLSIESIAVVPDGRILIGGVFTVVGGVARSGAALLEGNGAVRSELSENLDGNVNVVAVDGDDRILIGGAFTNVGDAQRNGLVRYLTNGAVDPAFVPAIDFGDVYAIAVQPDGRIVIGGSFRAGDPTTFEVADRIENLARLESNGALDRTLPDLGLDGAVHVVRLGDDGSIIIGGEFTSVGGEDRTAIARLR